MESNLDELKALSIKLTETELELSAFWHLCPVLLCIGNKAGFFTKVNPQWTVIFGWTEEQLTTNPYKFFIHPDDIAKTIDIEMGMKLGPIGNFYNRYRTISGDYKTIEWVASRYIDDNRTYAFGVVRS